MITGNFGAFGGPGGEALNFEQRRWERLFVGEFTEAKTIMARLDARQIPNRLAIPDGLPTPMTVVVEVRHRWMAEARQLLATSEASRPQGGN